MVVKFDKSEAAGVFEGRESMGREIKLPRKEVNRKDTKPFDLNSEPIDSEGSKTISEAKESIENKPDQQTVVSIPGSKDDESKLANQLSGILTGKENPEGIGSIVNKNNVHDIIESRFRAMVVVVSKEKHKTMRGRWSSFKKKECEFIGILKNVPKSKVKPISLKIFTRYYNDVLAGYSKVIEDQKVKGFQNESTD